ncbi:DUF1214 domain-containing protein [Mycobacterium heckeshornense]|nr:DUF1214 domain-containing protein [Mycobacterium heckeshornense]KMV20118.1 hypothetical protein ACT16_20555 [Mycobacterium heckeshornense]MCV7032738.1 DUF1214 domain-containing protein [Mycobacterium heckeshornense]PIJ36999.1 DUF1214 domain-containing protein [Mycobacterium heckeshornense]
MNDQPANPAAWLPFSIVEAARAGRTSPEGVDMAKDWTVLLSQLGAAAHLVTGSPFARNRLDLASGFRHLLVLAAIGIDEVLRFDPDPILAVSRAPTDDVLTWGMDCPDAIYTRATLWGGESYRLFGNRGTARYVGLQTMNGIQATANAVVDELEMDQAGNFEVIISADEREGNWLRIDGDYPTVVVRHFFYDWNSEVPSSLRIERIGRRAERKSRPSDADGLVSRQVRALGEFVYTNLRFFHDWGSAPPANGFLEPGDLSAVGAAAENRPVIGRWELGPDEALILEIKPPNGVYWSYSLGNPWWETIHYGRHQSSLNGHQVAVDSDGLVRVVVCARDPGVANWLDTAGYSNGAMILRCVRTDTAPTPITRVVKFDEIAAALPADTKTVTPDERTAIVAARRRAVHQRFAR